MRGTDSRKLQILGAIVEDYVATREPVGSKSLLERHELGVSAATVRNDMSALEEEGLIHQPHTSAGRVPTDKGYRTFVDHVATVKPLSVPERRAIHALLEQSGDVEELLARTVRLLAQLTQQVAMVQYPARRQARVRHVELVKVAESLLLVVLILESGRVDQRTIPVTPGRDAEYYAGLRDALNRTVAGREVTDLSAPLGDLLETVSRPDRDSAREVAEALIALAAARVEDRIMLAGTANLARSAEDFARDVEPLLDVLEEQLVLLRLFTEMHASPGAVEVRIGSELRESALTQAAVVGAGYGAGSHLAILGPSRMDYVTGISTVQAIARYVSRYLE
ncbi:heat-inducible transcriptional repressor HrcA [Brachybacterium sp. J144]|uniref:heat-inducible transcriptional repressor HrcA n=1 Tax=unclassified Brachybacterium TaxID=2623841 RepID=UPI002E79B3B3|nr:MULTISPECIES: heat-inducible transcriptional repressor HrcA [unclassified Brachybacterium]MEE1617274.1 heat-inducible transcriptional repressor HrcA [Brachybacterium sp. J153]MEE1650995.1 heat-inducible transcriptional repressor HrcA [Brachybacterium sp. J144]